MARFSGEGQDGLAAVGDAALVARAQDGDPSAFREIVRRHAGLVRAYTSRIVGSVSEADDVAQNVFVTAWRQLDTVKDPAAIRPWLMRIATREAYDHVKRRPANLPLDGFDPRHPDENQPETAAIRNAQLVALSAALDSLPEDQRRCWLLREIAELSYTEIAEEMDTTPSTIRGLLSRARTSLTIHMEGWR